MLKVLVKKNKMMTNSRRLYDIQDEEKKVVMDAEIIANLAPATIGRLSKVYK